jgi:uncharacterized surface protein with fasciclin (FAS1) repeats
MKLLCRILSLATVLGSPALAQQQTIYALGEANPDLSTLISYVDAAGLTDFVETTDSLTLLAPINDAFSAIDDSLRTYLESNVTALDEVLKYHLFGNSTLFNSSVPNVGEFQTLQGENIFVSKILNEIAINEEATVLSADVLASNGVVQVIDRVLLPPGFNFSPAGPPSISNDTILNIVENSQNLQTLLAAIETAPVFVADLLLSDNHTLTLFAPDDDAFSIIDETYLSLLLTPEWSEHLVCFLTSHIIDRIIRTTDIDGPSLAYFESGESFLLDNVNGILQVAGIPVTTSDIEADNGIVQVISAGPIIPSCLSSSIYEIGLSNLDFSTVIGLVDAAGLVDFLNNTLPLTFFAPSNTAFALVPQDLLSYLEGNGTALTEVLEYHVISSMEYLNGADNLGEFTSLQGDTLDLTESNEQIVVNGKAIVSHDHSNILASNGVIHVIDQVLIPPSLYIPDFENFQPVTLAPAMVTLAPITAAPDSNPSFSPVATPTPPPTSRGITAAPYVLFSLMGGLALLVGLI